LLVAIRFAMTAATPILPGGLCWLPPPLETFSRMELIAWPS